MADVIWSPEAVEGLENICEYIATDSPRYAEVVARRVLDAVERAAEYPLAGRIVPEVDNPDIREKITGNFRIIYRTKSEAIEVVMVRHGARIIRTDEVDSPDHV